MITGLSRIALHVALLAAPASAFAQTASSATPSASPTPETTLSPAPPPSAPASSVSAAASPTSGAPTTPEAESVHADSGEVHPAEPAPLEAGLGRLRVAVNRPDTEVIVDGRDLGIAPVEVDLPRGVHTVRLTCSGYKTWDGSVDIDAGMLTPLRALLRPELGRSGGITVLVLGALMLGAGITLGALSAADHNALDMARMAGTLDNHDPRIDRGAYLAMGADAAFALAIACGAAGIYLVAHDPTEPSIARFGRSRPVGPTP